MSNSSFTNQESQLEKKESALAHSTSSLYWDYSDKFGPTYWLKNWNTSKRQSPIDIDYGQCKYDPSLKQFNIDRTAVQLVFKNFGKNITILLKENQPGIHLSSGPLKYTYQLRELHFHWGTIDTPGSEHTLNGLHCAAEMHIVHWNNSLYKTEAEAMCSDNGLAVIGVFLDANVSYKDNESFNLFLDLINKVHYKNEEYHSEVGISPYILLPENISDYFSYFGSLTTPPLTENVHWTIFKNPLNISVAQLKRLNSLFAVPVAEKNNLHTQDFFFRQQPGIPQPPNISGNNRPSQEIYHREVCCSFKI